MKLTIDTDAKTVTPDGGDAFPLYSDRAFDALSDLWLKVGWNQKYVYTFTWMGVPIIQLPEDIIRTQEVVWRVKPDVIIECGVAHGGGAIFLASLCKAMGKGRVIGVEIEFRGDHRSQIEHHPLGELVTLVEAGSTEPSTVETVRSMIKPGETVLVLLDSNHSYQHVADELEAYHDLVTPGSYIVATDGCMEWLTDVPRGNPSWSTDNPAAAARDFLKSHTDFVLDNPVASFNESTLTRPLTHWPDAWLKRVS